MTGSETDFLLRHTHRKFQAFGKAQTDARRGKQTQIETDIDIFLLGHT